MGVKASLVESQQMLSFVFMSFHRLLFCINFLSSSFYFAFMSFHFAFMAFHVPSLCIKDTGLRKLICSNRSVGYLPKGSCFFSYFVIVFVTVSFSYRFGGMCRLPSLSFTNMCMYKLSLFFTLITYRFLGRQCIGSVKVQAKLK